MMEGGVESAEGRTGQKTGASALTAHLQGNNVVT